MSKRINIILPDATAAVLDRVASKGNRSRLISQAILRYVETESAKNLRQRLKEGALVNAGLSLEIAKEWFPAENEAWQQLDQAEAERAPKRTRAAAKSTSRRSTRR